MKNNCSYLLSLIFILVISPKSQVQVSVKKAITIITNHTVQNIHFKTANGINSWAIFLSTTEGKET